MMKFYSSLVVICFFFVLGRLNAQYTARMEADATISSLMNQYLRINKSVNFVSGWRITVISTVDRRVMEDTRVQFQKNFSYKTKWEYKEPYYHLRAGAFLNRSEAMAALDQVKKKFGTAFISVDKIEYTEF